MKKLLISLTLSAFLIFSVNTFASEQLISLNKYWCGIQLNDQSNLEVDRLEETELIRFHLEWVIDSLNRSDLSQFSAEQIAKRKALLSDLSDYAKKGEFPINSYHWERTPYFIDDAGTACAVGHLIIQSGHSELAQRVSNEMNYAYIEDMPYQEIEIWASDHGFSLDELKWIQPGYGPQCAPGQVIQPVCANTPLLSLGCFNPDWQSDGLIPPLDYLTEIYNGSSWGVDSLNQWQFWGAAPGQYRITITDSTQRAVVYQYTITAPPAIAPNDSVVNHASSQNTCDGNLIVQPQNGLAPYQFMLMNPSLQYIRTNSTGIFDSLCPAVYTLVVNDSRNCQTSTSIQIQLSTGLADYQNSPTLEFPNPVRNHQLQIKTSLNGQKMMQLINLNGEVVRQINFNQKEYQTDLNLSQGLYVLQISNGAQVIRKKVIVSQ